MKLVPQIRCIKISWRLLSNTLNNVIWFYMIKLKINTPSSFSSCIFCIVSIKSYKLLDFGQNRKCYTISFIYLSRIYVHKIDELALTWSVPNFVRNATTWIGFSSREWIKFSYSTVLKGYEINRPCQTIIAIDSPFELVWECRSICPVVRLTD